MEIVASILRSILSSLYQQFGAALVLTVLFMFTYLFAKKEGWKLICIQLATSLKSDSFFRKIALLVFFIAMILFRTVLCRNEWRNPLSNLMGGWAIYNEDGSICTEGLENIVLFVPLTMLLFWTFSNKYVELKKIYLIPIKAIYISFLASLSIELSQLFFKLGTFQISDLFFNTLGGFVGGMIYSIIIFIRRRKR